MRSETELFLLFPVLYNELYIIDMVYTKIEYWKDNTICKINIYVDEKILCFTSRLLPTRTFLFRRWCQEIENVLLFSNTYYMSLDWVYVSVCVPIHHPRCLYTIISNHSCTRIRSFGKTSRLVLVVLAMHSGQGWLAC